MNKLITIIQKEWEKALLNTVLVLILISLGIVAFIIMNSEKHAETISKSPREQHNYFNVLEKNYLASPSLDVTKNPLEYKLKIKIPPGKPQQQAKPQQPPKQQQQAQAKPQPQKQQAQAPATPPPPPEKITVKYRGCIQLGDDIPVALTTATSSKNNKAVPASLKAGDKILNHITINEISGNEIHLSFQNENITITKGATHTFTVK